MSAEYSVEEALTMVDRIAIAYGSQELEDARAVLAERIKAGEGVVVGVCIPFGHGKVVVTTGKHGGVPCVYLAPASMPGVVGESAARENLPRDKRVPGESILTFPTAEQAAIVAAALCGKSVHPPAQSAQDAQSVAIYPVGHFIETSAGEYARVSRKHECDGDVFQLYRSTGNAQSVDVDAVLSVCNELRYTANGNHAWRVTLADKLTAALQEKGNG